MGVEGKFGHSLSKWRGPNSKVKRGTLYLTQ
jgi:hypothetical protein